MQQIAETRLALIALASPHRIEVRFRPNVVIDSAGIAEIMIERKRLCGDRDIGILVIIPADADLDVAVINVDHYKVNRSEEHVLGMAMVANNMLAETLISLYNAYYPPRFPIKVFGDEGSARAWLDGIVDGSAKE